jgi:hypothetical protein
MAIIKTLGILLLAFVIIPYIGIVVLKVVMDVIDTKNKFD